MRHDPLTLAVALVINERFGGIPGTIHIIDAHLDPARGDSLMVEVYEAIDRIEARISQRESSHDSTWKV